MGLRPTHTDETVSFDGVGVIRPRIGEVFNIPQALIICAMSLRIILVTAAIAGMCAFGFLSSVTSYKMMDQVNSQRVIQ